MEVHCAQHVSRPGRLLAGPVFPSLELLPVQRATCIFTNVRLGAPAISIWKQGEPAIVEAGETVTYSLYVHNPGFVSFAEGDISVTDENCDDTPERVDTGGDETLDPGDTWIYRCSRSTPAPGDDCQPGLLENSASVDATAPEGSASNESPPIETILLCPDQPTPPTPVPPEPPGPPEPGPVVPPGPTPPVAGEAGRAGVLVRRAIGGCIGTRAHRVNLRGTRMSRVRVYVNGGLRRRLTVETLQRRVTARVTVPPGRYRIAVRVRFERGSGTPAVTLRDTFRTCAAQVRRAPAVTG